ncbi:hypothetical protein GCM10010277_77590 [Streptomyces longisporoflavus]|uniref:DUF4190 domain-containing protein n=1 Tax=Streptomyces longisporoflavus TaxID=28044 RepID=UPI00167E6B37|nr:DUF4190 domain-containing protein [Streptomyces longisporoflavus]GGV68371.1 hypothetical protein GCM10010277_77590 [Streptomyces longisporoflavus]
MSFPEYPQTSGHDGRPPEHSGMRPGNGMAIAALVLGILAILLFWTVIGGALLGLLAVIFGIIGARKARGGRAPHGVMSIIGAVLGGLGLIASGVIIAIGASILNSDEYKNFDDCIKHADTKSERDACAKDFDRELND